MGKNDAGDAKQGSYKKSCTLHDIELCEKEVQNIWRPDELGEPQDLLETYCGEAFFAYYYCIRCQEDWVINSVQTQEQAWKLVKEHLSE